MEQEFEKLRRQAEHCRFLARQTGDPALAKIVLDAAANLEREALQLQRKRGSRAERPS